MSTLSEEKFGSLRPLDALSPRGLAGKREYVMSLEGRADPASTQLLVECLEDESGYMRDLAEASLVRLRAPAESLVPLLSHGLWYTRVSAARALGRLRAREATDGLARLT
ncbi:MAG: HEAT repeat domain-containing protein, partial [Candidatus Eiseniibacteriota bacterium]